MTRRVTIPDDHVALILSSQLADELMTALKMVRTYGLKKHLAVEQHPVNQVCGHVMLALLEAKEA